MISSPFPTRGSAFAQVGHGRRLADGLVPGGCELHPSTGWPRAAASAERAILSATELHI